MRGKLYNQCYFCIAINFNQNNHNNHQQILFIRLVYLTNQFLTNGNHIIFATRTNHTAVSTIVHIANNNKNCNDASDGTNVVNNATKYNMPTAVIVHDKRPCVSVFFTTTKKSGQGDITAKRCITRRGIRETSMSNKKL